MFTVSGHIVQKLDCSRTAYLCFMFLIIWLSAKWRIIFKEEIMAEEGLETVSLANRFAAPLLHF